MLFFHLVWFDSYSLLRPEKKAEIRPVIAYVKEHKHFGDALYLYWRTEPAFAYAVGVMYSPGWSDSRERPDEPIMNFCAQRDRELEGHSEALASPRRFTLRRFPLPDGSELLVYSGESVVP